MPTEDAQMRIRIPDDVKDWLKQSAKRNLRTQNAEIVMALMEKMNRERTAGQTA